MSTSPSQTAQHRLRSQLCPTCPCLKSSVWEGLGWVTPLGLWPARGLLSSDSQGNQAGAQGSHHRWHQLHAECVGKWQTWGVVVGLLLSNQHWFTCCCFLPFWVSLRAARTSCPTHVVAQPHGLQHCSSAASLPGVQSQPSQPVS